MSHLGIELRQDHWLVALQSISCSWVDVTYDIQELIKRIGHEAVSEMVNDVVINSTNSEVRCLDSSLPNNDAEIGKES